MSVAVAVMALWLAASPAAHEGEPAALLEPVHRLFQGRAQRARLVLTVTEPGGKPRERLLRLMATSRGGVLRQLLVVESPADLRNLGVLSVQLPDEPEVAQWIYLPALRRASRLVGAQRSGAVFGSDLSFADLSPRSLSEYTLEILDRNTRVDGEPAVLIQAVPRTEAERERSGYVRSHFWVSPTRGVFLQAKTWLSRGNRLKYIKASEFREVSGVRTPHLLTVRTLAHGKLVSQTTLQVLAIEYPSEGIDESEFSLERLERGL